MTAQVNKRRQTSKPVKLRPAQPFDLILQSACNRHSPGDVEQLFHLLRQRGQGIELDEINASGMTALTQCALDGNLKCVQTLVQLGANVNGKDKHGWTALHHAVSEGYPDIVGFLLRREADVRVLSHDGETALDLANTDELRTLLFSVVSFYPQPRQRR